LQAKRYDELWKLEQHHWWFQARRLIVCSMITRYVDDAARRLRICDLGCGTGGNLASLAERHDVTGIEYSPQALAYARRRLGKRVRAGRLPDGVDLPDESFDVVLLTDVLEHIENDADSAKRALQLLRPGGIIVATVPAYQWLYSPRDEEHHHFRRYSKEQFQTLWALPNSEVAALSFYNSLLFPLAAAVRLASKFAPRRATLNDLTMPPRPLNTLLTRIMQSESHFIGRIPIHFGLSLIGVVRKR
jgi:SAM-dependent methyltransferase